MKKRLRTAELKHIYLIILVLLPTAERWKNLTKFSKTHAFVMLSIE